MALIKTTSIDPYSANTQILEFMTDNSEITIDMREFVAAAMENGIISGFDDKTFRPKDSITRAQAAVMIDKLLSSRQ